MATKAKYFRVKLEAEKEEKPETDILMRFNDSYGMLAFIQDATSLELSIYSLDKINLSSPSKPLKGLVIKLYGLPKSSKEE